ncbi:MAG: phosphodiester glycosidase family protein, partial [Candidatus Sumerlaeia bacterium]|nr:phosphodiester glycosidase family protein [Candidatus Sumerlaeia bacterium]
MRIKFIMMLTLTFLLSFIFTVAESTYWFDYVVKPYIKERKLLVKEREIHPGVIHITEFKPEGPYLINVLKVNLRQQECALEVEKGQDYLFGGEKVSQIAQRENKPGNLVIAGINGDFWRTDFIPIGPFVDDGMIFKSHHIEVPRAVFMLDNEMTPYIGVIKMNMVLEIDEATTCPIDVINANGEAKELPPEQKDLFLFTPAFGNATRTSADDRTEVILENLSGGEFIPNSICRAKVLAIRQNAGNTTFTRQQLVLSGTGKAKEFLEQNLQSGKEVKIKVTVSETTKPVVLMIGGGPILLQKGEIKINNKEEGIGEAFVTDKHPRTAIGYSRDKNTLFLYTIDGRQPGLSIGADLYQVAEYLKQLGAYEAMNLDGGGSTTM